MKQLLTTIALVVLSSFAFAQEVKIEQPEQEQIQTAEVAEAAAEAPDTISRRLESILQPTSIFTIEEAGLVRLDINPDGNNHFFTEVSVIKTDFAVLGITRENGFNDERVILQVRRNGVLIYTNRLTFDQNFRNYITFKTNIQGPGAPALHSLDRIKVFINGRFTLKGQLREIF